MFLRKIRTISLIEQAYDKTYNKTCTTSAESDQPAHSRSLSRVFAERMRLIQSPGYPKRDKREPLPYWVDVRTEYFLVFVCVEVLRPSQPNGVMSSAVSLPNHTFTGQA